jgi:hypothetical protein
VLLGGVAAFAQDSATLTVTVFDPSAAIVPGAKVALTDLHRGTVTQVETGDSGFAVFDFLQPGDYSLVVEKPGFETHQVNLLTLQVRDRQTFRVELKVAVAGTSVQVTAKAQTLSSGAAEGVSLEQNYVQDLPDNGRNAESLIFMAPGIVPATDGSGGFDANGLRHSVRRRWRRRFWARRFRRRRWRGRAGRRECFHVPDLHRHHAGDESPNVLFRAGVWPLAGSAGGHDQPRRHEQPAWHALRLHTQRRV